MRLADSSQGQFSDDHLDMLTGGLAKDTCEDGMMNLCLNTFGRNRIGSHYLRGMG
jgi:hypothetical protein